jgi:hypothetical protein
MSVACASSGSTTGGAAEGEGEGAGVGAGDALGGTPTMAKLSICSADADATLHERRQQKGVPSDALGIEPGGALRPAAQGVPIEWFARASCHAAAGAAEPLRLQCHSTCVGAPKTFELRFTSALHDTLAKPVSSRTHATKPLGCVASAAKPSATPPPPPLEPPMAPGAPPETVAIVAPRSAPAVGSVQLPGLSNWKRARYA